MHYAAAYDFENVFGMLFKSPFSVNVDDRAILPFLLGYRLSCTPLQIACFGGKIRSAKCLLKFSRVLNQESLVADSDLIEAFEIAVLAKQDVTGMLMLHQLWRCNHVFFGDYSQALATYCAKHDLHRILAALICKISNRPLAPPKTLVKFDARDYIYIWDHSEARELFDYCAANGMSRSCIILLHYINLTSMCPPVIQATNMPLMTFMDLIEWVVKRGQWNIFYSGVCSLPPCSDRKRLSNTTTPITENYKEMVGLLNFGDKFREIIDRSVDFCLLSSQEDRQAKAIIITARGKTAIFHVSKEFPDAK